MIAMLPLLIFLLGATIVHALPARTFLRAHRLEPKKGWWMLAFSALEAPINLLLVTAAGLIFFDIGTAYITLAPLVAALAILLVILVIGRNKPQQKLALTTALPRILSALLSIGCFAFIIMSDTVDLFNVSMGFGVITYLLTIVSAIQLWKEDIANRKWTQPIPDDKFNMS